MLTRLSGAGRACVVVPVLLSAGYHVRVDIATAVRNVEGATAAPALGPDPRLVDILRERLLSAGAAAGNTVVLASAGSRDPQAAADVEATRSALAERWDGPVVAGFGAGVRPSVGEAVTAAREVGSARVAVAAYLLAPGHFHDRLARAGADVVTDPLLGGPVDTRIVDIVLERYLAAMAG